MGIAAVRATVAPMQETVPVNFHHRLAVTIRSPAKGQERMQSAKLSNAALSIQAMTVAVTGGWQTPVVPIPL